MKREIGMALGIVLVVTIAFTATQRFSGMHLRGDVGNSSSSDTSSSTTSSSMTSSDCLAAGERCGSAINRACCSGDCNTYGVCNSSRGMGDDCGQTASRCSGDGDCCSGMCDVTNTQNGMRCAGNSTTNPPTCGARNVPQPGTCVRGQICVDRNAETNPAQPAWRCMLLCDSGQYFCGDSSNADGTCCDNRMACNAETHECTGAESSESSYGPATDPEECDNRGGTWCPNGLPQNAGQCCEYTEACDLESGACNPRSTPFTSLSSTSSSSETSSSEYSSPSEMSSSDPSSSESSLASSESSSSESYWWWN